MLWISKQDMHLRNQETAETNLVNVWASRKYLTLKFFELKDSGYQSGEKQVSRIDKMHLLGSPGWEARRRKLPKYVPQRGLRRSWLWNMSVPMWCQSLQSDSIPPSYMKPFRPFRSCIEELYFYLKNSVVPSFRRYITGIIPAKNWLRIF